MVGHSVGGRACLEVARQAPNRVAKLVLVAAIGFGKLSLPGMVLGTAAWALFKAILRPLPYPPLEVQLDETHRDGFGEVDAPTLILWGKRDRYFPSRYAERALELIPNSRLELFTRSGHSPHRDEPSAFNRVVLDLFSSSDTPG